MYELELRRRAVEFCLLAMICLLDSQRSSLDSQRLMWSSLQPWFTCTEASQQGQQLFQQAVPTGLSGYLQHKERTGTGAGTHQGPQGGETGDVYDQEALFTCMKLSNSQQKIFYKKRRQMRGSYEFKQDKRIIKRQNAYLKDITQLLFQMAIFNMLKSIELYSLWVWLISVCDFF